MNTTDIVWFNNKYLLETEYKLVTALFREIFLREEVFGTINLLLNCIFVLLGDSLTKTVLYILTKTSCCKLERRKETNPKLLHFVQHTLLLLVCSSAGLISVHNVLGVGFALP